LPSDTNGVQDVYQWEAPGAGSCDTKDSNYFEPNEGCISLISTGKSPYKSELVDSSADGSDVFFTTLSSIDEARDPGLVDIYDARVEGGFPPPPEAPECAGDACQSVPPPPNDQTPASAAFGGPGNPPAAKPRPRRCAKGKVRRKGRCVAKKHKRSSQKQRQRRSHDRRAGR